MHCINHEDKEAVGTCAYCGKFFCQDCLVDINGRNYCKEHVVTAIDEQANAKAAAQQPNIIINNENTNTNNNISSGYGINVSPKSRTISALLCFFLGILGIHRFYVGKIGTGILYLCTGGFCGLGALIDFVSILIGSFRDKYGMIIKNW